MPRADLSQLLGNVEEPGAPATTTPSSESSAEPAAVKDEAGVGEAGTSSQERTRSSAKAEPQYLRLVRKETRLREDQQNLLTLHARRLGRARVAAGPRITDNTLIRVAVDLLLARIERASGDDESAILESLK